MGHMVLLTLSPGVPAGAIHTQLSQTHHMSHGGTMPASDQSVPLHVSQEARGDLNLHGIEPD